MSQMKRKSDDGFTKQVSFGKKPCQQTSSTLAMSDPELDLSDTETEAFSASHGGRDLIPTPTSVFDDLEDRAEEIPEWLNKFMTWSAADRLKAIEELVSVCDFDQIRHLKKVIQPHFQRDFIFLLPKEISLYILSFLEPADLINTAQTCRYWRILTEDTLLWRQICEEEGITESCFPPPPSTLRGFPSTSSTSTRRLPTCYRRSPYKALYIRHRRIEENWRRNEAIVKDPLILRGHDEHVITCLLLHNEKIVSGSDDNTLRIWSATSGHCLRTLTGHSGGVWSCQLSSDGRLIVSGSTDRTVRVWNMETGQCIHVLHGHTSTVRCMALQGNTAVTGSRDTTLRVWDIQTGECKSVLSGHVFAVRCVQFDGRRVVSGAYDHTVKVWDVESETLIYTLTGHENRVYSLEFDSVRDLVISGSLDTTIRVWDLKTGQCVHTLVGHRSLNSDMQLCGNFLVSGNADSTIKIWDIVSGQCLQTLAGPFKHQSAVTCLQVLENGLVATSSDDGTVKLWDTRTGDFVRDLIKLETSGSGGVIWRLKSTNTVLVCAVGSRNGIEDTKLLVLDFNANFP